jgi:hypothetical protein
MVSSRRESRTAVIHPETTASIRQIEFFQGSGQSRVAVQGRLSVQNFANCLNFVKPVRDNSCGFNDLQLGMYLLFCPGTGVPGNF